MTLRLFRASAQAKRRTAGSPQSVGLCNRHRVSVMHEVRQRGIMLQRVTAQASFEASKTLAKPSSGRRICLC